MKQCFAQCALLCSYWNMPLEIIPILHTSGHSTQACYLFGKIAQYIMTINRFVIILCCGYVSDKDGNPGVLFPLLLRSLSCEQILKHVKVRRLYLFVRTVWWRHQMGTFSALLALFAGNSPVTGEFPAHRPVTQSFDVFYDLRLNKPLSKQSWGWWFETPSRSLRRQYNVTLSHHHYANLPKGNGHIKCLSVHSAECVCLRLNKFAKLSFMQYMGLCVFSLPISSGLLWTSGRCLGLGHEMMACAVCLFMFLWYYNSLGDTRATEC